MAHVHMLTYQLKLHRLQLHLYIDIYFLLYFAYTISIQSDISISIGIANWKVINGDPLLFKKGYILSLFSWKPFIC